MKKHSNIFFAGQIAGVEGYVESIMSGLIAGISMARHLEGKNKINFNNLTITGALCNYISSENVDFQPMNANFGILTPLEVLIKDKQKRKEAYGERAIKEMAKIKETINGD